MRPAARQLVRYAFTSAVEDSGAGMGRPFLKPLKMKGDGFRNLLIALCARLARYRAAGQVLPVGAAFVRRSFDHDRILMPYLLLSPLCLMPTVSGQFFRNT